MIRRLKYFLYAACLAFVMRACVVEPVRLTDDSMSSVFGDGDVAFVSKLSYGIRVPGAGWQTAAWFVANADRLGIEQVAYASRTWTRGAGAWKRSSAPSTAVVATMATLAKS